MAFAGFSTPSSFTGWARAFLLAFLLLAIGMARSGYAADPDVTTAPDSGKALGPGDTVVYAVAEDKAAPVKLRVSDTGFLAIPIIGNVPASGKSCPEVAALIKKKLDASFYYNATVALSIDTVAPPVAHPSKKVSVSGKVVTQGLVEYPYNDTLTVSQAISKAGGPNQFGDLRKVTLRRKNPGGGETKFNLNLDPQKGNAADDMVLQDGDKIDVGAKIITFGN